MDYLFVILMLIIPPPYKPTVINKPFPFSFYRDTTDNYIIIHYDNGIEERSTFRWLRRRHTAYHYFITRDGIIYKLIDPKYRANHAGMSKWNGHLGMNEYSIGICLQNDGQQEYTTIQYRSLAWLIRVLKNRYPDITNNRIIGHEDIAWPKGRKQDPGKHFDWLKIKPDKINYGQPQLAPNTIRPSAPIALRIIQPIQYVQ